MELISVSPRSNKKEKELVKLIERYNSESDLNKKNLTLEKIKGVNFHISSAEKTSYVLSKCEMDKEERIKAREFLDYYRSQRNTVHNLGIHKGKPQAIVVDGIEINLDKDRPSFTSDHNSATFACRRLMEIYEVILNRVRGVSVF
ncbi:TPA: hypothetical protein ACF5BZ_001154 [Vibrio parahaemolyticus]